MKLREALANGEAYLKERQVPDAPVDAWYLLSLIHIYPAYRMYLHRQWGALRIRYLQEGTALAGGAETVPVL